MEPGQTRSQTLLIFTNLPDEASAQSLATALVSERLAACVNVLAPCRSTYRWQGAIENAQETPVLIKTTESRYAALEAAIRARHPYELPEIVAVPVAHGLPEYLSWIAAETLDDFPDGNHARC
jgi:periplasmic divalent cation tolerance protein